MHRFAGVLALLAGSVLLVPGVCRAGPPAPLSEWKFDGDGLNQVAGMPAAVAVGGAVFRAAGGVDGGYAHVSAGTDWIQIASAPAYDLPTAFTVEFWFRQFADQGFVQRLLCKGDDESANYAVRRLSWDEKDAGSLTAAHRSAAGLWRQVSDRDDLAHARWHHLVYTKNAAVHACYLDGERVDAAAAAENAETNASPILLGDTAVDTDFDELRIYDRALTAWEVSRRHAYFPAVLHTGFEEKDGGFSGTGDWEWGTYVWAGGCPTSAPPAGAHAGGKMWGTVLDGCYHNLGNNEGYPLCLNVAPENDSVLAFTVNLEGLERPQLGWWEWFDVFLPYDWAQVTVDGVPVFAHCMGDYVPPAGWACRAVDLTPYEGRTVAVEFRMMSSTTIERSGWYIDDVTVQGRTTEVPGTVPASVLHLLLGD